jgi:hypothetical protein
VFGNIDKKYFREADEVLAKLIKVAIQKPIEIPLAAKALNFNKNVK